MDYTIKDSFRFARELQSFDSEFWYRVTLYYLPLQETIDLCVENLFKDGTHVGNWSKDSFCELLTMPESLILFDQEFYKRHDGVVMGSPLGSTFSNVFLCCNGKIYLQYCPSKFKPFIYRRYVVDKFLLFCSKHHIPKLFKSST